LPEAFHASLDERDGHNVRPLTLRTRPLAAAVQPSE
jgi:hypothetical protein